MNTKIKVISTVAGCALLLTTGIGVHAAKQENELQPKKAEEQPVEQQKTASGEVEDETVYVFAKADGAADRIVVSDWLKGQPDSYKKYESGEDLPVQMKVSYKLDGSAISPDQLAGKSGHVEICYDFINTKTQTAQINGKKEELSVPFVAITGVMLDNNLFSHVQVEGGKLVNDGNRTAVVGLTFPGMKENLDHSEKLELSDRLVIKAEVKNFELMNTMTLITNEVFNELDLDGLDDLDSLSESMDELSNAMIKLMDGSGKLVEGLDTLSEKSNELTAGVDKLSEGSGKLKGGSETLAAGIQTLSEGIGQLHGGLDTLSQNSAALNAGAAQIFDSILAQANQQIAASGLQIPQLTKENYAEVLNGVISSMGEEQIVEQIKAAAREKVSAAVNEKRPEITEAVTAKVREEVSEQVKAAAQQQVLEKVLQSMQMTKEQYEAALQAGQITEEQKQQIDAAVANGMATEEVQGMINAGIESTMQSEEVQSLIASKTEEQVNILIEQNMNSPEVQQQITEALNQAQSGAATISALKGQLDSINTFYQGVMSYTAGVDTVKAGSDKLAEGAGKLQEGAGTLKSGMNELDGGINTLKGNVPALLEGVRQLADGSKALSNGLHEFDEKGIQKLIGAVDDDLAELLSRVRETLDISKEYNHYAGTEKSENGVKFIYRTESVK